MTSKSPFKYQGALILCLLSSLTLKVLGAARQNDSPSCGHKMAEAVNYLNFRLFETLETSENLMFSPMGLSSVMGMMYLAADNKTSRQMENVLGYEALNIKGRRLHQNNQQLNEGFNGLSRGLVTVNGLFHQEGLHLQQFRQELKNYYNAEIQSVDFEKRALNARKSVNDWASSKTSGKIEEFLHENLPLSTKLLLLNAVYFKEAWKIQFPRNATENKPFYVGGKNRGMVPMMSLSNPSFPYTKDEYTGYKYLELPYKGDRISMLFVLPPELDHIPTHAIHPRRLCDILSKLVVTKLRSVQIPKFRLSYGDSLKETLSRMGLTSLFEPGSVSFFGPKNDFHVSDVVQKSVIEVNEEGTEAASITSVAFIPLSAREIDEFVADRPFDFYIIHKPSKIILFSGKVKDATSLVSSRNKRRQSKDERPAEKRLSAMDTARANLRAFISSFL